MAHRTIIDGTGHDIKKGRTLINGTGYDIKKVARLLTAPVITLTLAELIQFHPILRQPQMLQVGLDTVIIMIPQDILSQYG